MAVKNGVGRTDTDKLKNFRESMRYWIEDGSQVGIRPADTMNQSTVRQFPDYNFP